MKVFLSKRGHFRISKSYKLVMKNNLNRTNEIMIISMAYSKSNLTKRQKKENSFRMRDSTNHLMEMF